MILNQQNRSRIDLGAARDFAVRLGKALALGGRDFNVCFVDDDRIRALNLAFRGKPYPTDVLSFPWQSGPCQSAPWQSDETPERRPPPTKRSRRRRSPPEPQPLTDGPAREFDGFLGDIVISVEAAKRNAAVEGHSVRREISWLILHGVLHLLGLDHETDHGEMVVLEHDLRIRLGVDRESRKSRKPAVRRGRLVRRGAGPVRDIRSGSRAAEA
jgi:ssRNA-specific RNase YbeY (16S rRNA maturation enzyme)